MIAASGQTISLPAGNDTSLQLLGASTSGYEETALFYVYYTDGTYDTFTQAFSDWRTGYTGTPGSTAPGESIVESPSTYNTLASGPTTGTVYLYGYVFPLNPAKTVAYIKLPSDTSIKVLAMDEVDQPGPVDRPEQVNLGDATDDASPAFNAVGITVNSRTDVAGGVTTYSANALGNVISWNGQTFDIGPASVGVDNEVVASGSPPIILPQGEYTSIQFLGSSWGVQAGVFEVDYTDGTTDFFTVGTSEWTTGYNGAGTTGAGESIAAQMGSYNSPSGPQAVETYLYGYVLPTNPDKTVMDLRTPNNTNIKILAIDVVTGGTVSARRASPRKSTLVMGLTRILPTIRSR